MGHASVVTEETYRCVSLYKLPIHSARPELTKLSESATDSPLRPIGLPVMPGLSMALWGLSLIGLLIRALRQPTIAGSYSATLDALLYGGQRLLDGQLLFDRLIYGTQPLAQWLFAPSAWLGSLQAHRLLILAINLFAGALLARALRHLRRADLIALSPGSALPLAGGAFYVAAAQLFPGGLSGQLDQFANAFLVGGLYLLSRVVAGGGERRPGHRLELAAAGASGAMALACSSRLASPLLLVGLLALALGMRRIARLLAVGLPLLCGALAAGLLPFLPYLFLPAGPALAWAGAVQLPLEQANRFPADSGRLLPLLGEFLQLPVAGLPVWLLAIVPCLALVGFAAGLGRQPFGPGDQRLLLPALAVIFLVETLQAFLRGGFESDEMQLLELPLVMVMVCGFAVMERGGRWMRGLASLVLLLLPLIFVNNVLLASLLHPPRQPHGVVSAVEADRDATRRYLLAQPLAWRRFTAPQDVALQRQLGQPASTTGIGPEWSLNHQQLKSSWATRTLALPTDPAAVCRQLTDPANHHLVWMRTDPEGPNTEAFFRGCLDRDPGQWQDISGDLKLASGEYRVFRRRSHPSPAMGGAGHAL